MPGPLTAYGQAGAVPGGPLAAVGGPLTAAGTWILMTSLVFDNFSLD